MSYRYEFYERLLAALPAIQAEAEKTGRQLGLDALRDQVGLYPGASSCPGPLPSYVLDAIVESNRRDRIQPMPALQEEFRHLIKEIFGDEYDGAALNTCESALRVVHEVLFAPPTLRKGDAYRARFITPMNEDYEYLGAYGRPFPPRYKGLFCDRSVSAGEFGVEAKALTNLDSVFVRYVGGRYEIHGIKPSLVPMLGNIDVAQTADKMRRLAAIHGPMLAGFSSIGYDTPGYGHAEKNDVDAPLMLQRSSELAHDLDLPHFVDCGGGLPVVGYGPADVQADLMAWSMDKAGRAPISGLLVGREEDMLSIRRALGIAGQRYGGQSSHGKALYAFADPGRDALIGLMAYLRVLHSSPERVTEPIDRLHDILTSTFANFAYKRFLPQLRFTKSYAWGGTEINYEKTWENLRPGEFGIPISTIEDFFSNTNPIFLAGLAMGISPPTVYSGNMFVTPGLGTLNEAGELIEERAQIGAQALMKSIEIVCRHAGLEE